MRSLTIHNKKLRELLNEKDTLVKQGRKISGDIEITEKNILKHDEIEKALTEKVSPKELISKGEVLRDEINKKIEELEKIGNEIMKAKLAGIPKDVSEKHYSLRKAKEELERDRNKIALKVQKIKDRAIPIIQKEVKPHLAEYEDIETATVKGEKIVVNVFSHLDMWKQKFEERKNKVPTTASIKK